MNALSTTAVQYRKKNLNKIFERKQTAVMVNTLINQGDYQRCLCLRINLLTASSNLSSRAISCSSKIIPSARSTPTTAAVDIKLLKISIIGSFLPETCFFYYIVSCLQALLTLLFHIFVTCSSAISFVTYTSVFPSNCSYLHSYKTVIVCILQP